jgi:hypothetical protein
MPEQKRREIASRGGVAAHLKGTAHEWTHQEAREASLKGRQRHARNFSGAEEIAVEEPRSQLVSDPDDDERPSPWSQALKKSLEDVFESQERATVESTATGAERRASIRH